MTSQRVEPADRGRRLCDFVAGTAFAGAPLSLLADDCSFRRYFRVGTDSGCLIMDAPPPQENVAPFIAISRLLQGFGYSVPRVAAADVENGFLLIDDFGDVTYTRALAAGADEPALYDRAMDVLIDLHRRSLADFGASVPDYTDDMLLAETALFVDWYAGPGLGLEISSSARGAFLDAVRSYLPQMRESPPTLVLRDFHVDNLMVLDGRRGIRACGLLDFQDAVIGPAGYDIVSLLQDSRRDVPAGLVRAMQAKYFEAMGDRIDDAAFLRSHNTLGAQRALKVFGIFMRQSVLYGNHQYLIHMPRLWHNLMHCMAEAHLHRLEDWIEHHVPADRRCPAWSDGDIATP